jgi:hypothetical protein
MFQIAGIKKTVDQGVLDSSSVTDAKPVNIWMMLHIWHVFGKEDKGPAGIELNGTLPSCRNKYQVGDQCGSWNKEYCDRYFDRRDCCDYCLFDPIIIIHAIVVGRECRGQSDRPEQRRHQLSPHA